MKKTSAAKFPDHIKRVEDSKTPFLEKVLRLIDSGDIIRFKSIDFWEECAEETGWKGIGLANRVVAKRDTTSIYAPMPPSSMTRCPRPSTSWQGSLDRCTLARPRAMREECATITEGC